MVNMNSEHPPSALIGRPYIGRALDVVLPSHRFTQNQNYSLKSVVSFPGKRKQ